MRSLLVLAFLTTPAIGQIVVHPDRVQTPGGDIPRFAVVDPTGNHLEIGSGEEVTIRSHVTYESILVLPGGTLTIDVDTQPTITIHGRLNATIDPTEEGVGILVFGTIRTTGAERVNDYDGRGPPTFGGALFRSIGPDRAHWINFRGSKCQCYNLTIRGFGRTRNEPLNDANRAARYPVHWHHAGDQLGSFLRNSHVDQPLKWSYVIHQTDRVILENCTGDGTGGNCGACFVTEDGNEKGSWLKNCRAYHFFGDRTDDKIRATRETSEIGEAGYGFWLHSQANVFTDCQAVDCWSGLTGQPHLKLAEVTEGLHRAADGRTYDLKRRQMLRCDNLTLDAIHFRGVEGWIGYTRIDGLTILGRNLTQHGVHGRGGENSSFDLAEVDIRDCDHGIHATDPYHHYTKVLGGTIQGCDRGIHLSARIPNPRTGYAVEFTDVDLSQNDQDVYLPIAIWGQSYLFDRCKFSSLNGVHYLMLEDRADGDAVQFTHVGEQVGGVRLKDCMLPPNTGPADIAVYDRQQHPDSPFHWPVLGEGTVRDYWTRYGIAANGKVVPDDAVQAPGANTVGNWYAAYREQTPPVLGGGFFGQNALGDDWGDGAELYPNARINFASGKLPDGWELRLLADVTGPDGSLITRWDRANNSLLWANRLYINAVWTPGRYDMRVVARDTNGIDHEMARAVMRRGEAPPPPDDCEEQLRQALAEIARLTAQVAELTEHLAAAEAELTQIKASVSSDATVIQERTQSILEAVE